MSRKILLIEPNYKNKYPPMGLMKISTYYKILGDDVHFFKGDLNDIVIDGVYNLTKKKLYANYNNIIWENFKKDIVSYIKKGSRDSLDLIQSKCNNPIISEVLKYYRRYYLNKQFYKDANNLYDRVGVTTLFTFHWDITIETIEFAKKICKNKSDVMVGGVMASILPKEIEDKTGIKPFVGTLSKPGILDNNNLVVDTLPLDYSILEEIDYKYPAENGYLAYMTRGCINKCKFCAVPKIEPKYVDYIPLKEQLLESEKLFGKKRDLLLLDNNILASNKFNEIIDEIKSSGFAAKDTYVPSNLYVIAINNIKNNFNKSAYIKCIVRLYGELLEKYGTEIQDIYEKLDNYMLLNVDTAKEENIIKMDPVVRPLFDRYYSASPRRRYVDFNQGIDARLITDEKMKKLSEISIKPVRIAFDHWSLRKIYEKAVVTAIRNGHKNLSNYVLYNFEDKPIELYYRLRLNVELCNKLNVNIYSFPMKYHPIDDKEYFSNRDYIGKYWNRKYIRTIQAILNSTKGKVGKGRSFFYKAFGKDEQEFYKLLYMPEAMIIYRRFFEDNGLTKKWWRCFSSLSEEQKKVVYPIIEKNSFKDIDMAKYPTKIKNLLKFYLITRKDAEDILKSKNM